ncbi:alpha/beta hydrolase [Hansschlegelia beijingensis]
MLVAPEALQSEATGKPPILLVHGERDEVIPVDALFAATDALGAAEIPAEWHLSPGVGHGIDPEGLRQGGAFLANALKPRRTSLRAASQG